jgi:uncharacterized protein (TIGR00369 family)
VATPADDRAVRARVEGVLDIALHRFLGVSLLDPADPARGICFPVEEAALNNAGVLHGGIVTALLDVACYLALLHDLTPDENAVTHDVTASLMRPVPRGARVQVRGSVVRRGRSIVFLRAEATVDGAVVAAGQVTKTLIRTTA